MSYLSLDYLQFSAPPAARVSPPYDALEIVSRAFHEADDDKVWERLSRHYSPNNHELSILAQIDFLFADLVAISN